MRQRRRRRWRAILSKVTRGLVHPLPRRQFSGNPVACGSRRSCSLGPITCYRAPRRGALLFLRSSFALSTEMQGVVTSAVLAGACLAAGFGGWPMRGRVSGALSESRTTRFPHSADRDSLR